jgi:hypothetical protein
MSQVEGLVMFGIGEGIKADPNNISQNGLKRLAT